MRKLVYTVLVLALIGCENKDINEGEEFRPRAVKDSFEDTHFTMVVVDGVEYIMTERDNNNPHEGFGFMAFRANKLLEKQDTLISYLKAMQHFQNKIYAQVYRISEDSGQAEFEAKFLEFLKEEKELETLRGKDLVSGQNISEEE